MLDYTFSEEQEMIRESVREFCEKKIAPIAIKMEETKAIPRDVVKGMAELGILAPTADPKYGGAGFDAVTCGIIAEELSRADPTGSIPVFYLVQASWAYVLNKYGTEEAKKEIFPKVCSGEWFLGIATTESDAGSDLAGMRTTLTPTANGYMVNGEKMYISGVREVEKYGGGHLTLVKQTPEAGTRGMTMVFLPLQNKKITITSFDDLGREGISTGGFTVDHVEVPKKYLIGEENKGFYIVHEGYEFARGLIAAICASAGLKSLENGMKYIKQRKCFGQPLGKFEGVQFPLAENYVKMTMLRDLAFKALWTRDQEDKGKAKRFETSKIVAMSKLFASEWACKAIDDVMQWQGAFAYTRECVDQAAYRAVRSFAWAEGAKEIMRVIVARELLGKDFITYK
ncbi:MAG: acyl-CoA/acyl-ACP dehydrogenase [Candidatus Thermoplasmatota archaeon]|nr:acyl-CoA/acyl-ACP dehydrogenase [Candidatus Thermoplasmatota archaeon]